MKHGPAVALRAFSLLALGIALLVVFSACSSGGSEPDPDDNNQQQGQQRMVEINVTSIDQHNEVPTELHVQVDALPGDGDGAAGKLIKGASVDFGDGFGWRECTEDPPGVYSAFTSLTAAGHYTIQAQATYYDDAVVSATPLQLDLVEPPD
jgi:hypothetical protein